MRLGGVGCVRWVEGDGGGRGEGSGGGRRGEGVGYGDGRRGGGQRVGGRERGRGAGDGWGRASLFRLRAAVGFAGLGNERETQGGRRKTKKGGRGDGCVWPSVLDAGMRDREKRL